MIVVAQVRTFGPDKALAAPRRSFAGSRSSQEISHHAAAQPHWQVPSHASTARSDPVNSIMGAHSKLLIGVRDIHGSKATSSGCKVNCEARTACTFLSVPRHVRLHSLLKARLSVRFGSRAQSQVAGGRDGMQAADGGGSPDFEGAGMPPLTLPLDLSAAPSLSLPEAAMQQEAAAADGASRPPQHPQQQHPSTARQDPDDERPLAAGGGPTVPSQAGSRRGSSAATSKRTSADETPRGSPNRPRTPPEALLAPDDHHHQQQQQQQQQGGIDLQYPGHAHLMPVVDQRLDTWPPGSRSPNNIRSAAQQLAQWQQQQQQQAGGSAGLPQWQQVCAECRSGLKHGPPGRKRDSSLPMMMCPGMWSRALLFCRGVTTCCV